MTRFCFTGHPLYAAVDELLNEKLTQFHGGVAVYLDFLASAPYRLHFFELSIRGKDARGDDIPLYGEVVAIREQIGTPGEPWFEIVPADTFLDLALTPNLRKLLMLLIGSRLLIS